MVAGSGSAVGSAHSPLDTADRGEPGALLELLTHETGNVWSSCERITEQDRESSKERITNDGGRDAGGTRWMFSEPRPTKPLTLEGARFG